MVLLRRFRDPIWVPRIRENWYPTGPYQVPNISLSKNPAKREELYSPIKLHLTFPQKPC